MRPPISLYLPHPILMIIYLSQLCVIEVSNHTIIPFAHYITFGHICLGNSCSLYVTEFYCLALSFYAHNHWCRSHSPFITSPSHLTAFSYTDGTPSSRGALCRRLGRQAVRPVINKVRDAAAPRWVWTNVRRTTSAVQGIKDPCLKLGEVGMSLMWSGWRGICCVRRRAAGDGEWYWRPGDRAEAALWSMGERALSNGTGAQDIGCENAVLRHS